MDIMSILGLASFEFSEPDYIKAHRHCSRNRLELVGSELCGCFYCLKIYVPTEITNWVDDNQTALCANCDIDAVIGSAAGFPVEVDFLRRMNDHWFGISGK
jgi:hypothetical protein